MSQYCYNHFAQTFSYQKFKSKIAAGSSAEKEALPSWRLDYDREVMRRLEGFRPDLCVLAGYMLIVGPEMCQKYDMLNLHPAAPAARSRPSSFRAACARRSTCASR